VGDPDTPADRNLVRFADAREVPVRVVPLNQAFVKFAVPTVAEERFAFEKLTPTADAPVKLAEVSVAFKNGVEVRDALVKLAEARFAEANEVPEAPVTPVKSAFVRVAPVRFTPVGSKLVSATTGVRN